MADADLLELADDLDELDRGFVAAEPVRFRAEDLADADLAGATLEFFAADEREELVFRLVAFF